MSGAATAAVTNKIEAMTRNGRSISDRLQALSAEGGLGRAASAMLRRGAARSAISAAGGMAGRSTEILFEVATGRYRGDAGDALLAIGEAGGHAAVQGLGEGVGEAVGQRFHHRTMQTAVTEIATERQRRGMPPLVGEDIQRAAADLLLLRHVSSEPASSKHLENVAVHGGLVAPPPAPTPLAAEPAAPARVLHEPDVTAAPERRPVKPAEGVPSSALAPTARPPSTTAEPQAAPRTDEALQPLRPATTSATDLEPPDATRLAVEPDIAPTEPTHVAGTPPGGGGGDESDRLFPGLSDAEIDAAFAAAEGKLLMRVPAESPGADTRPVRTTAGGEAGTTEPTLLQRQRAGALHEKRRMA